MSHSTDLTVMRSNAGRSEAGFSMVELLIAMGLLLTVSSIVASALMQMSNLQQTIWNRTEMHSGVRGAAELLQQEVGQAGSVGLPGTDSTGVCAVCLAGAVLAPGAQTVSINQKINGVTAASVSGMFPGEQLVVDAGPNRETVTLTPPVNQGTNQITAVFATAHAAGAAVATTGGFASGIVPPSMANGSTATVLKLYGDINADGNMLYVEYTCDTAGKNLYRNTMAWNAASKPALTAAQILLSNIIPTPGNKPCFTYQTATVGTNTYVTVMAITLTMQTQQQDPITKLLQTDTTALLNVSPRNVINTWQLASLGYSNRVQPMPPAVQTLLP